MAEYGWPLPQVGPQLQTLVCDMCGEDIEFEEEAVEIFIGKAGYGPKSRQPMVVDNSNIDNPQANLHPWCVAKFARQCINDDQLDDERYCASCEVRLEGEE